LGRLTALQERILKALAPVSRPWTRSGGGALVGFHLAHRSTRDVDLFWHDRSELGSLPAEAAERLRAAGLTTHALQSGRSHHRLRVRGDEATVVVDLVDELGPTLEPPELHEVLGRPIRVDTRHEILVNKLCALLGRSEIRDLQDVERLLATCGELERACADCPQKDAGFSALTLSWALRDWPVTKLAIGAGIDSENSKRLERFRDDLTNRLLTIARPGASGP